MSLKGKKVALLEARMSSELSALVERQGGTPYSVPAVRESAVETSAETVGFVDALCAKRFQIVIFMTGVGASSLLKEAEKSGRLSDALAALRAATTVCRGAKPVSVLRKNGVQVNITAAEPHTTVEVLQALDSIDVRGTSVGLVHYGERNDALSTELKQRGAAIDEVCLYEWHLPEDVAPLERLIDEIIAGKIDALAVTSQIQIRHLFQIADTLGKSSQLADALNRNTVVAAVGPVCATALRSVGVIPHVQPAHPKMGPMMIALADYFDLTAR